jgi:transposase
VISEELRAEIRRKFFAEHWKIGTIASTLGLHHMTVRSAVEGRTKARLRRLRSDLLGPYKSFIADTLKSYPKLVATRLLAMIAARGYVGGVCVLRRYVRSIRPKRETEAFFRLTMLAGEQAQVDWADFGKIRVGNTTRALSCFVMVLSYSRAMYARFVLDMSMESFLRCHQDGFASFGGTPRRLLYDNLKNVVLERIEDVIRFNPRLLEFAGHYHFAPVPCAVARGNEKGRVERSIRYLRESFFEARHYRDLADLNAQLRAWIADTADARVVPDDPEEATVREAFEHEQTLLLPLPLHLFETRFTRAVKSGKTPYIRFDKNDYSIPHALVRKPLTIVASEDEIRVLDGTEEVARHARCWEWHRQIECEEHLASLAQAKEGARANRGCNRLFASAPHAKVFLEHVSLHGGHLGGTTSRLLRLLDTHGTEKLDRALAQAIENTSFSARSVAFILDQQTRASSTPTLSPVVLPNDPRVQQLNVTPRPLATFDVLAQRGDKA